MHHDHDESGPNYRPGLASLRSVGLLVPATISDDYVEATIEVAHLLSVGIVIHDD